MARLMHEGTNMEFLCQHCDEMATGTMYRVFSEDDGVLLLNMIVCRSCYDQARALGLDGEEAKLEQNGREAGPEAHSSGLATDDQ